MTFLVNTFRFIVAAIYYQRILPGFGYVNETSNTTQAQVPGGSYVNNK